MKAIMSLLSVFVVVSFVQFGYADIASFSELKIDFTDQTDANEKATWSETDQINITAEGLGWDGEAATLLDGWIKTKPLGVGLAWRPTCGVGLFVGIQPPPKEITLNNGQKSTPYYGSVFARYSPDQSHWSTWQALQPETDEKLLRHKKTGSYFRTLLQVPMTEQRRYRQHLEDYSKLDVPWKSDEDAAVRWLLRSEPDFFAHQLPFVGYVQFLYENSFHGGQRIRSISAQISWNVSGFAHEPRDEGKPSFDMEKPWSFVAEDVALRGP